MKKFNKLAVLCQSRGFNLSLQWQPLTKWSIEVYIGYSKSSYTQKFYADGHLKKNEAIRKAINYMNATVGEPRGFGTPQY